MSEDFQVQVSESDALEMAPEELEDRERFLIGDEAELELAARGLRNGQTNSRPHLTGIETADRQARRRIETAHHGTVGLAEEEALEAVVGGHLLLIRRDEVVEHALLVRLEGADGVVEAVDGHALLAVFQRGERPRRIREDVHAAEEGPARAGRGDLEVEVALRAEAHRRPLKLVLRPGLPNDDVRPERPHVRLDECRERRIADLLLSLDEEGHVAIKSARGDEGFDGMHAREPGAFVVGRTARPHPVALDARRKIDRGIGGHTCRV